MMTRGIKGAPKRSDYVEMANFNWAMRPGRDINNAMQTSHENWSGIRESRKNTPDIERNFEYARIKQLETNPFAIKNEFYRSAQEQWMKDPELSKHTARNFYLSGLPDPSYDVVNTPADESRYTF
jgi:hypothetical protein